MSGSKKSSGPDRVIPDYPGVLPRGRPAPPKYIVRVDETTGREVRISGSPPPVRPVGVTEVPSAAKLAAKTHAAELEYGHVRRSRHQVDSRHDTKGCPDSKTDPITSRQPPQYIGTTYRHQPNSLNMRTGSVPTDPSIPVPYVATPKEAYADMRLLTNRLPAGDILGSQARRYVDVANVPSLRVVDLISGTNDSVGPDNPVKQINDTWSECWDDEVQGIYYYNKLSGEATWLPPDELRAFLEKRKFANNDYLQRLQAAEIDVDSYDHSNNNYCYRSMSIDIIDNIFDFFKSISSINIHYAVWIIDNADLQ